MHTRTTICILLALSSFAAAATPPDGYVGGGVDRHDFADHMPAETRRAIELELAENAARLIAEGKLAAPRGALSPGSLGWPLRARQEFEFDDYHGISNFVDLDPNFPGELIDYTCGMRSYDLEDGYNHAGVDYFLWPFPWHTMDQQVIEIVAVAPGTILAKHDGNDDRNCAFGQNPNWNAVYVQHADGSVAWYGHMVKTSLTEKAVGDTVTRGEYLGLVGSSGSSTGPHLHLELRASSEIGADIYEPHEGACNDTIDDSLWEQQRAYYDTALNGTGVHVAAPSMKVDCPDPGQEEANLTGVIGLGEPAWFSIYFRDSAPGQPATTLSLYRPDGDIYHQWQYEYEEEVHYAAWWFSWGWSKGLGTHPDYEGEWRFEAEFDGQTVSRTFYHGESAEIFDDRFEAGGG